MNRKTDVAIKTLFAKHEDLEHEFSEGFVSPTLFKKIVFTHGACIVESGVVSGLYYRFEPINTARVIKVKLTKLGYIWFDGDDQKIYILSLADGEFTRVKSK